MSRSKVSAYDANAKVRSTMALKLRSTGMTLEDVAKQCGYSGKSGAYQALKRELSHVPVEDVEAMRKLENQRLDYALEIVYKRLQDHDSRKDPLWGVDRIVAICKRRSELNGLDVKVEVQNTGNQIIVQELAPGYLSTTVHNMSNNNNHHVDATAEPSQYNQEDE